MVQLPPNTWPAVYLCAATPEQHAANLLGERIQFGRSRSERFFTLRDVHQRDWRGLKDHGIVAEALGVLEKAAWIRSAKETPGTSGGRPSIKYHVNPHVLEIKAPAQKPSKPIPNGSSEF